METKQCQRCKGEFPKTLEYFYRRYGREVGLNSYCKKCFSIIQSEKHSELKKKMLEYRGDKCVVCGYDKHDWNLTFHHQDPSKKEIKIDQTKRAFTDELKKELDKCVVMCHLCHGDTHHGLHPEFIVRV